MKKRNKKYKPKIKSVPRIINFISVCDARPNLIGDFHLSVMAFTLCPSHATCNEISAHLCKIAGAMSIANNGAPLLEQKDEASKAINDAINVIELVGARYDKSEQVSISVTESTILRRCAGKLDAVLSRISACLYDYTEKEIRIVTKGVVA